MRKVLIWLSSALLLWAHSELEKVEEHLYTKLFAVDFAHSSMKKSGYGMQLKYGMKKGSHNIVLDHKVVHIQTSARIPKNLLVRKYALGYQYLSSIRTIFNFLYVSDSLIKEADDVRVFGVGMGYGDVELKIYYKKFRRFDSVQGDLRYYFPHLLVMAKANYLDNPQGIAKNGQRRYLSLGAVLHDERAGWHYGFGGFVGRRAFTVMEGGYDMEHHPFEFRYSLMAKAGRRVGPTVVHLGLGYARAKELPTGVRDVRVKSVMVDVSLRF